MTYTCPPLAILCLCAQGRFGETNMAGGGLSICTPACNGSSLCSDRLRSFSFSAAWLELLLAILWEHQFYLDLFLEVIWYILDYLYSAWQNLPGDGLEGRQILLELALLRVKREAKCFYS